MTYLISENKYGKLYKLKRPYIIELKNTSTPFGLNKSYNKQVVCWYITNDNVKTVRRYEEEVMTLFEMEISSKISKKDPYPYIIETQVNTNLDSSDCIEHLQGEIVSYNDIMKGYKGTIILECEIVNISMNKVMMIWYMKRVMRYDK
jgi:hypothetical protein